MLRSASTTRCVKASLRFIVNKPSNHIITSRLLSTRSLHIANKSIQDANRFHTQNHVMWRTSNMHHSPFTCHVRFYSLPSYTKIDLPALSPTMEMGTIASWVLKEGDHFEPGDLLAEIETDKATVGFEAQDEGYIAKILVPEGTKEVPLGTLIAISVDNEEDIAAFKDFTPDQASGSVAPPAASPTAPAPSQSPQSTTSYPRHERISLPALSPTMTTGTIAKWAVKEGDKVEEGDLLADIETDKATMAMEAENEGFIAKIIVSEGTKDIPLGTLLCIQVENESDVAAFASFVDQGTTAPESAVAPPTPAPEAHKVPPPVPTQPAPFQPAPKKSEGRVFVSPLARKLAIDKGVDLSQVQGSGPSGRVRQQDVLLYLEKAPKVAAKQPASAKTATASSSAQPAAPSADYIDIPLTNIRKTTAKRLIESKQTIPHYYLTIDCNMAKLTALRKEFNAGGEVKLSVNDFVIKAASLSCLKVPEVNSSWQDTFIRQYNNVDVSVAVSTDTGLITPIVFNAHTKGLGSISQDVSALARKARDGKLQPQEFIGGTFTISNLGMFGIKDFTAIINPPQSCILAVGRSREECVPDKNSETGVSAVTLMSVTLSCDHRVVDGAVGAQWLQHFKKYIENPTSMLL
uniref:dihydrolipoyllysine-residue acetyltransferase component of pyruvate dehydrogenase complex, mitochondrial-like n=1 Tax=Styela clava TaxID=7725 RepID=UPI0019393463|nr:dihydrolipoyllysine-residue acetyltransferase component of pyruvate dehydrogenase complex, mitochondrial-like [Styela clava]